MFARKIAENIFAIFHDDGEAVTRIEADVYPVGSEFSAKYEHPGGIRLVLEDVQSLEIEVE